MNISELARKLKIPISELRQKLPAMGFDVGLRAIKVDDRVAQKIIANWKSLKEKYEVEKAKVEIETTPEEEKVSQAKIIKIPPYITVRDLATKLDASITKVLASLMKNGVLASMNERIDFDTAAIISSEFGFEVVAETASAKQEEVFTKVLAERFKGQDKKNLKPRAPVVVVMGHVDHGKTKLLDTIRKTNVVATEAGGITQHIGAYQVERAGRKITFIDTPGHEAFTTMRSRGARVADVAILVVAADDGFKPQTEESLKIIKSAGLPLVVAINKIDKPEANPDLVKKQLAEHNLTPEEWGGQTVVAEISAKANIGLENLLDLVLLVADLNKDGLQANPDATAIGTIIESHVDKGEGPVATVLIQDGTLKVGDGIWVAGNYYGKIRVLKNFLGKNLEAAAPAVPAKVIGLKAALSIGDVFEAGKMSGGKVKKYQLQKQATAFSSTFIKGEEEEKENVVFLNLIIKADVLGSLEAIISSLESLNQEEVKIKVISKGLGNITSNDVENALASQAVIFGFHVTTGSEVLKQAAEKKVEIKLYQVIYQLIDEAKKRLQALLKPEVIITELGRLKILAIFRKEKDFEILGGEITKGKVVNNCQAKIFRAGGLIGQGVISQVQQNKVNVTECKQGQECGVKFEGKPVVAVGDILEFYSEEVKARKLTG